MAFIDVKDLLSFLEGPVAGGHRATSPRWSW
jgi:hypothetical protein